MFMDMVFTGIGVRNAISVTVVLTPKRAEAHRNEPFLLSEKKLPLLRVNYRAGEQLMR